MGYFVDREVEHPGRVNLQPIDADLMTASIDENGVVSFSSTASGFTADMTRAEGEVYTEGTPLNAVNLNGGIESMVSAKAFVLSATHGVPIPIEAGTEMVVAWSGAGANASRGIDYVWITDGAVISRSFMLSGTQLILYSTAGQQLVIENSASATTVHVMVIGAVVAAV